MNNTLKMALGFVSGACVGGVISYMLCKKHFTARIDKEIESLNKFYEGQDKKNKSDFSQNKPSIDEVMEAKGNVAENTLENVSKTNETKTYTDYTDYYKTDAKEVAEKPETPVVKKPYVISPEEFGTVDYDEVSLTYFADKVLTEDGDKRKLSVKKTIGSESLKHFGEYAKDSLYVRNDERHTDYEVLKDERAYTDVYGDSDDN